MALFDSEQERINRQRHGSQDTSQGFQRPERFRGPSVKSGPNTIPANFLGPVAPTSQSRDFRRVLNGQAPIAPTLQSMELKRALDFFSRPRR